MGASIGSCCRDSATSSATHDDIPTNVRVEVADKTWAEPAKNQLAKKAPKTPTSSWCFHTKLVHNANQITDKTCKDGEHFLVQVKGLTFLMEFFAMLMFVSSLL
jgi:hypothetical protein